MRNMALSPTAAHGWVEPSVPNLVKSSWISFALAHRDALRILRHRDRKYEYRQEWQIQHGLRRECVKVPTHTLVRTDENVTSCRLQQLQP